MKAAFTNHIYLINLRAIAVSLLMAYAYTLHAQFSDERKSFGMRLGGNYTLNGTQHSSLSGAASPILGVFFGQKLTETFSFKGELAYAATRYRQTQSDTRYNCDFLDANLFVNLYPYRESKDFSFILGIKPSYLIDFSTEEFITGSYQRVSDPNNMNEKGDVGISAIAGISVALSPIVEVELTYNPSFNDKNSYTRVQGRPGTIEFGLRFNAVNIKNQFSKGIEETKARVANYHKGVLLVMLSTPNEAEIKTLESQKRFSEIVLIKNELALRNNKIVNAFRENFTFCPVYYYYDTNAYKVMRHELHGILLDKQLLPNESITLPDSQQYFIASFCEDNSNYTGRNHFGLYVYNNQINQLSKPFNTPSQLISMVLEGDPLNYVKRKRTNYAVVNFNKYVVRFNNRLLKILNAD